jgi:hypothetical protein
MTRRVYKGVTLPEQTAQEIVDKALYALKIMKGNCVFDYGKLQSILEGKA